MSDSGRNTYAAAIIETIPHALLILDVDLRVHSANPAFLQQFGVSREEIEGCLFYELSNGQWNIPELRQLLEQVLRENQKIENYRVEHDFEMIGEGIMLVNANRIRREGAPDSIVVTVSDVTERERLFELQGRKEFAEKLIDSVRESLLILGRDLRVHSANKSFYDQFKIGPAETEGRFVYELGNRQWDIPELRELLGNILPNVSAFDDFEVAHDFESIGRRIMLLNARRLDYLNLIVLAIRDVTERRQREMRQETFMGELQHRVNNILHNVRSLAMQTRRGRDSVDDFFVTFDARLGALSRNQDLLLRSPSEAVSLREIVRVELDAVGAEQERDFTTNGPTVHLPPRDAQAIGMMVHELTTNAAKYGALHAEGGQIEIIWQVDERHGNRYVSFRWRERGMRIEDTGPAKGFGSRVIEDSLPRMLGGTAELTFHPDGAECRVEFPLAD